MTTRSRTIEARAAESQRGTHEHQLIAAQPGRNRYRRGHYRCSCGQTFTGMNAFEQHRATTRRIT